MADPSSYYLPHYPPYPAVTHLGGPSAILSLTAHQNPEYYLPPQSPIVFSYDGPYEDNLTVPGHVSAASQPPPPPPPPPQQQQQQQQQSIVQQTLQSQAKAFIPRSRVGALPAAAPAVESSPSPSSTYRWQPDPPLHYYRSDYWEGRRSRRTVRSEYNREPIMSYCRKLTISLSETEDLPDDIPKKFVAIQDLDDGLQRDSFGCHTRLYKVMKSDDKMCYTLRKMVYNQIPLDMLRNIAAIFSNEYHPSLVVVRESFHFDGNIYVVQDFVPGAQNLYHRYLINDDVTLSEPFMWALLVQVLTILQSLHSKGLPCRCVNEFRIMESSPQHFYITGMGVFEIVHYAMDPLNRRLEPLASDLDDLWGLCRRLMKGAKYSSELTAIVERISRHDNVTAILQDYTVPMLEEEARISKNIGYLEEEIFHSFFHGRLLLLLSRLNWVLETPPPQFPLIHDALLYSSSGAGSNSPLMVKRNHLILFRDYLFGQQMEEGQRVVNFGFIVSCLTKLDNGSEEKILLSTRDGKSLLRSSFTELKAELNELVQESLKNSVPIAPQTAQTPQPPTVPQPLTSPGPIAVAMQMAGPYGPAVPVRPIPSFYSMALYSARTASSPSPSPPPSGGNPMAYYS